MSAGRGQRGEFAAASAGSWARRAEYGRMAGAMPRGRDQTRLQLGPVARAVGVVLIVALAGCGRTGGGPSYPSARLEGAVTIDRQPVEKGTVQFVPPAGSPAKVVEADIKDGRYVATGVPIGKVRVLFTAVKETGRTDTKSTSQPVPEVVNLIPESYRDGLEITVAGDNPNQNFELKK
jgi:hypothetical protein